MTKPFLRTLFLTIVCLKNATESYKCKHHNIKCCLTTRLFFVASCFFFYSRIMVRYIDMKNIGYVKRVSDQCVFLFSTYLNSRISPAFFGFFFFEIYFWKRLCGFASFFLSSFTTFFSPYFVVLRICIIFYIKEGLYRGGFVHPGCLI